MAFSPECPKGGFPRSWARHAADTMEPISVMCVSESAGCFFRSSAATSFPNERPTHETSRLWVRRLCTKMLPGSGNTWVLFCRRRNGAEKISRS